MRAGICSVQQSLTPEALNIVKQAVSLARRRGHSQVTPLHVASAMLSSLNGLLRTACLQSHSHPLQCKALDLCFNVALNRLPASTSNALLAPHSSHPSLSNALVAAFKRAQAHQRRGSIENQQQPILALKIEIEQFIISILDDPSVSRVMREAGFSSTQVKNNVERAVSLEICSPNSTTPTSKDITKPHVFNSTITSHALPFSQYGVGLNKPHGHHQHQVSNEDVMSVLNALVDKKRNLVITGECLATTESIAQEAMEKIERGVAPGELKFVRFMNFPLYSLRDQSREEVEHKLVELRCIIKSNMSSGVVLYLGDLKWVSDFWSNYGEQRKSYYSCGEHIVMEMKRLIKGIGEYGKLWLIGSATFQTYMKCKKGHPSLETLWELYPLTVPLGSLNLGLSLNLNSDSHNWPLLDSEVDRKVVDFSVNFDRDTKTKEFSSNLPLWLQDATRRTTAIDRKEHCTGISPIFKRWNSIGSSVQKEPSYHPKPMKFASSPPSPVSISSHDCDTSLDKLNWPVIFETENFSKDKKSWLSECNNTEASESNNLSKPDLLSNPNSSPNSASSSEALENEEGLESFKEFTDRNLKMLSSSLAKKVPWQEEIIPDIAKTILECRSNLKKKAVSEDSREDSWLCFLGLDVEGKQSIAKELARVVFGSQGSFVSISLSSFASSTRDDTKKRERGESGCSHYESLGLALNENPHRVMFIEDFEQVDYSLAKALKEVIRSGRVTLSGGENVPLKDAIVIFSCECLSSPKKAEKGEEEKEQGEEKNGEVSVDLNVAIEEYPHEGILECVDRLIIFKNQH